MDELYNMELAIEERAKKTIEKMTLEEKVSQLVYKSKEIQRLGFHVRGVLCFVQRVMLFMFQFLPALH